jgi:GNAT superfamily N-acetyltransferase
MNIILREAVPGDLPAICGLLGELPAAEVDFEPDYEKQYRGLSLLCGAQTLVSTAEGGYSLLIEDLVVHRDYRRCGLGARLPDRAAEWAAARGIRRMQLLCDETSHDAQLFYASTGWERTRLRNYFRYLNGS